MRPRHLRILIGLTALLALSGRANATVVDPLSMDELIFVADQIVTGEVVSVTSRFELDGRGIVTHVEVRVDAVLKGAPVDDLQQLWVPGGSIGDQFTFVGGAPSFVEGERVLLFLEELAPSSIVLGMFQGKFTLAASAADGETVVFRGPHLEPGQEPRIPVAPTDGESYAALRDAILQRIRVGHVPPYRAIPGLPPAKRAAFRALHGLPVDGEVGR